MSDPRTALDIAAENFSSSNHDLGRLELVARPREGEWHIDRLLLANEAASGNTLGSGVPRYQPATSATSWVPDCV